MSPQPTRHGDYRPSRRTILGVFAAAGVGAAGGLASIFETPLPALAAGARYGLDYAWQHPSTASITSGGYTFVCRYLSNSSGKNLSKSEADSLKAAGIDIVCNWEAVANAALNGYAQGVTDAQTAQSQAAACGMPSDRPIYFSVDFDAQVGQQAALNAYFDGVASVIGRARTGAYGGYYPIGRLFDAGKITWAWQTYAWSGGNWDSRAQVRQIQNGIVVGGADCDRDQAMTSDFGQWGTGGAPTSSLAAHPPITTVASAAGSVDVFWKGTDGGLWHKWFDGSTWNGPTNMNVGTIGSEPAAVTSSTGVIHLFWKGTDNNLWHKRYDGTTWLAHESLGAGPLNGTPVAVGQTNGIVDVFWKGTDNGIWHKWYSSGSWYGPESMNVGQIASEPVAVSATTGVVDLFWKGTDNAVWHKNFSNGAWHSHESLGGSASSAPTAVGQTNGIVDVFWKGTDGTLWHKWNSYGTWYGPESMNVGQLGSVPVAISSSVGVIDIFWTGTDKALWHTWFAGNAWQPQQTLGFGPLGSAPVAVGHAGLNEVFWKGTDGALWHSWFDGSAWQGPLTLGGSIA